VGKSKRIIIVSAVFIVLGLGLIALSQVGYPHLTGNLRDYFKNEALIGGLLGVAVGLVFLIYAFFSKLKRPARAPTREVIN
jgi:membrane-anchored glycerophosphoryl diester phosphodiesterase (GDPDase)